MDNKETYTLLSHKVGDNDKSYTGVTDIEIKVRGDATLPEMMQAFAGFLKAIGYSSKSVDEIIEPE